MNRQGRPWLIVGAVVILVLFGGVPTIQRKALAEPLSHGFTYTSDDTVKTGDLMNTIQFLSLITNTGSEPDTYAVVRTENPPTPEDWWMTFCVGGICWDSLTTVAQTYLEPGNSDMVLLDIIPRSIGKGSVTITVESMDDPELPNKSLNFTVIQRGDATGDGKVDVGDVIYLVNYLFRSGTPPFPLDAGDANCDGKVDVGDAIYLVNYLFKAGPIPSC